MTIKEIINFLLIAGVIQGFAFNLVTMFVKKKCDRVIVFLNLTVLFLSMNNLQRWLIDNGFISDLFLIKHLLVPWYLLVVPMFYAFTIYFLQVQDKVHRFIKTSIGLFVLEILIRLSFISYAHYEIPEQAQDFMSSYNMYEDFFNLTYMIFLFLNTCILIFRRHHLIAFVMSYDDLNWIKWFIRMGVFVLGCWAVALIINSVTGNDDAYLFLRFSSSILLYWMGYQGFYKYNVLRDRIVLRSNIASDNVLILSNTDFKPHKEEEDFFNDKHDKDFAKIKDYIIKNKLYLDPLLGMESLASDLGMSKSYFSKLVNSYSDYNFSDFINSFRVEQAKKFLANDEFSEYTIVAIGLECGFNSKSTFYSAFKKFTSITPTAFRHNFNSL